MVSKSSMAKAARLAIAVLLLAAAAGAQSMVAVHIKGNQKWPAGEADKLYLSACSVVQRQYGGAPVRPQITVVLGAEKNEAFVTSREIHLTQWNPYLFVQGVVAIAFENLMSPDQRLSVARRALLWADATVETRELSK